MIGPERAKVQVLAPHGRWAGEAAVLLGWPSPVVAAQVVGVAVSVSLRVDEPEVTRRAACIVPPAANPALLACWAGDPSFGVVAPVQAAGFLVPARSWRAGSADGGSLSAFAGVAVALPTHPGEAALFDADLRGMGVVVVDAGGCRVLVAPAPFQAPPVTRMQRLVGEVLFGALLASTPEG